MVPRKDLLLAATSGLFAILLSEGGYRLYLTWRYQRSLSSFHHALFVPLPGDPLRYVLNAGATGQVPGAGPEGRSWSYVINPDGFRGRPAGPRFAGVKRLLFLGDSYAFGWELQETEPPFPSVVEALLNARPGTPRVEVVNAGVPGYNTLQEAELAARLLPRLRPDAVILAFVMKRRRALVVRSDAPTGDLPPGTSWLADDVKGHAARVGLPLASRRLVPSTDYLAGFTPGSPKAAAVRGALRRLRDTCASPSVSLLVLILPDFTQDFGEGYPYRAIHEAVGQWGRDLGVPVLDLLPELRGMDHRGLIVPGESGHPSVQGHREIAARIVRAIATEGLGTPLLKPEAGTPTGPPK